jgi:tetratricopeptide (TPR) repeat protein
VAYADEQFDKTTAKSVIGRLLSVAALLSLAAIASASVWAGANDSGRSTANLDAHEVNGPRPASGTAMSAEQEWALGLDTESLDAWNRSPTPIVGAVSTRLPKPLFSVSLTYAEIRKARMTPKCYYHNSLGWLQAEQGKYSEAEKNYLRAVAITEAHYGPNHPDLADHMNNLAGTYRAQARFAEAVALYQRCIKIWENYSGSDDPNIAPATNQSRGCLRLARPICSCGNLFQRALRIQEKTRGMDHPEITTAVNNLAWMYVKKVNTARPRRSTIE